MCCSYSVCTLSKKNLLKVQWEPFLLNRVAFVQCFIVLLFMSDRNIPKVIVSSSIQHCTSGKVYYAFLSSSEASNIGHHRKQGTAVGSSV